MTEDQKQSLRVRIAEWCGWEPCNYQSSKGERLWKEPNSGIRYFSDLPNYPGSLDAIALAEARLTGNQWDEYCDLLGGSLRGCASATSEQRAQALCRVIEAQTK